MITWEDTNFSYFMKEVAPHTAFGSKKVEAMAETKLESGEDFFFVNHGKFYKIPIAGIRSYFTRKKKAEPKAKPRVKVKPFKTSGPSSKIADKPKAKPKAKPRRKSGRASKK